MTQASTPAASELPTGREELHRLSQASPLAIAARSFVFVRHGETDGNRQRIYQTAEQPLNANGLAQARAAAAALRQQPIARIVASTMPRAWVTAETIAAPHGMAPEPCDLVRERWFGSLVGTPSANIDWAYDPPGGERLVDFVARTREGFQAVLTREMGSVVVAHGGNLHVLAGGLGLDLPPAWGANASPLLFERGGSGWQVTPLGEVNPLIGVAS